jgi:hypothetical protein
MIFRQRRAISPEGRLCIDMNDLSCGLPAGRGHPKKAAPNASLITPTRGLAALADRLKSVLCLSPISFSLNWPGLHGTRKHGGPRMTPFEEGVTAAHTGMSRDDNPYKSGTPQHSDWNAGYDTAVDADEATKLDNDPD